MEAKVMESVGANGNFIAILKLFTEDGYLQNLRVAVYMTHQRLYLLKILMVRQLSQNQMGHTCVMLIFHC